MDIIRGIGTLFNMLIFNDQSINLFSKSRPITTSQEALEIGTQIMKRKYPFRNLDRYTIRVSDRGDFWAVFYALIDPNTGRMMKGGGGPSVSIRKSDGKIITSEDSQR